MKKVLTGLAIVAILCMVSVLSVYGQNGAGKKIQLKIDGKLCTVEAKAIKEDKNGLPAMTIFSEGITGSISMSASDMCPIVACAKLNDGTILDPILLGGGVEGGSGYSSADNRKTLAKSSSDNNGGSWESSKTGKRGYLMYCFDTELPIADVLIGTYADYIKSNYKEFVSTNMTYNASK